MNTAEVLIPSQNLGTLTYSIPIEMDASVGSFVKISVRNKIYIGIIISIFPKKETIFSLKDILEVVELPALKPEYINFLKIFAQYYLQKLGASWKLAFPIDIILKKKKLTSLVQEIDLSNSQLAVLSLEQLEVYNQIITADRVALLKGITGSGKTEIYLHLVMHYLKSGAQVLVMLPEIALSTQMIQRFEKRLGFKPAIWNSSVTPAKRRELLLGIITGEVKFVLGSRSALPLPFYNLGLIVIDEEHDNSYKQEEGIIYNARDMSIMRSKIEKIKVVLCSATPSIESIVNCNIGKYKLFEISSRFGSSRLPRIVVVNMLKEKLEKNSYISPSLLDAISKTLDSNQQILLFLNRRGYAPLMLCKACGYKYNCRYCSSSMVFHKSLHHLECHYCGMINKFQDSCESCHEKGTLLLKGPGVEKIAEEVMTLFPNAKVQIATKDSMNQANIKDILNKIENKEIDIIIGTQIITKGYHFPHLTLVGIIDGDLGLSGMDLRSTERTFQLLNQVSGRAGREDKAGFVYLQTYQADNLILKALVNYDEKSFYEYEIGSRQASDMPPFSKMAAIIVSGIIDEKVQEFAKLIVSLAPIHEKLKILGPAAAIMHKLKNKYRYRILVCCHRNYNIQSIIESWFGSIKIPSSIKVNFDIDPYSFY